MHPIILATETHKELYKIQAFDTGNDLICRLAMNYILLQNNYEFIVFKGIPKQKKAYFKNLEKMIVKNEDKDFQLMVCENIFGNTENIIYELQKIT